MIEDLVLASPKRRPSDRPPARDSRGSTSARRRRDCAGGRRIVRRAGRSGDRGPGGRRDRGASHRHRLRDRGRLVDAGRHRAAVRREAATAGQGDRVAAGRRRTGRDRRGDDAGGLSARRGALAGRPDGRSSRSVPTSRGRRYSPAARRRSAYACPITRRRVRSRPGVGPLPTTSANVSGLPEASDAASDPRPARRLGRSRARRRTCARRPGVHGRRLQRLAAGDPARRRGFDRRGSRRSWTRPGSNTGFARPIPRRAKPPASRSDLARRQATCRRSRHPARRGTSRTGRRPGRCDSGPRARLARSPAASPRRAPRRRRDSPTRGRTTAPSSGIDAVAGEVRRNVLGQGLRAGVDHEAAGRRVHADDPRGDHCRRGVRRDRPGATCCRSPNT